MIRSLLAALFLGVLFSATALGAVVRIVPSPGVPGKLDVDVRDGSLSRALEAIAMRTGSTITLQVPDRELTLRARSLAPEQAARALSAAAGLLLVPEGDSWVVIDRSEPTVTLDVQDEDVRTILRSVAGQCGIRNLMIDPGVAGKGTFLFHEVRCGIALRTIFGSLGLAAEHYPSSVVRVKQ
ncbi:MAG TPA: hypothetical protein VM557_00120 [Thermoanaerobaculia bacterium]|nr:hypothetical protein [Thermoanaerobaculia bacterium]